MGCGASKSTQVVASTTPAKPPEKETNKTLPPKPTEAFIEKKEETELVTKNEEIKPKEEQPKPESNESSHQQKHQSESLEDHTTGTETQSSSSTKPDEIIETPKQSEVTKEQEQPKQEEHPFQIEKKEHKSDAHQESKIEAEIFPQITLQSSDQNTRSARPPTPATTVPTTQSPLEPIQSPLLSPRKITEEPLPRLPIRQLSADFTRPRSLSPRPAPPAGLKLPPITRSSTLAALVDQPTKTKVSSDEFKDALLNEPKTLKRSVTSHNIAEATVEVDKNLFPGAKKKSGVSSRQKESKGQIATEEKNTEVKTSIEASPTVESLPTAQNEPSIKESGSII